MNITDVLEKIGQQPNLKGASLLNGEKLLSNLLIPKELQVALLTNDKCSLEKLAGYKQNIICMFIASPAREREIPKDDNKPPQEDQPFEESSLLKAC